MSFIAWNDRLSVGVKQLDDDHHKLIDLMNELYDAIQAGHAKEKIGDIIDRLVAYSREHFAHEESLFAQTAYSEGAAHKKEHDNMLRWATKIRREYGEGQLAAPALEVMNQLKDWFYDHINGTDKKYGPYLNYMGIH